MPIEPQIPLAIRPFETQDPLQVYGNALAIRSHQQGMQLQQKQMQAVDLENQQRQMQIDAVKQYNAGMKIAMGLNEDGSPAAAAPPAVPPVPASSVTPHPADDTTPDADYGTASTPGASTPPSSYGAPATPNAFAPKPQAPAPLATPAAPARPPASIPGHAGIPTIDYDKFAQYMISHGQGSQVMGVLSAHTKFLQEVALQHKTEAEAHADQMALVMQAFQGVNRAPEDQKEAVYQQALRTAIPLAQRYGIDASQFPAHYDPATTPEFINESIASATKIADFARQTHEAADLQFRISAGIPKTAKELEEQYHGDVSLAQDQTQLDAKNAKWKAIANTDKTGTLARILAPMMTAKWTPDLSQDATLESLKPDERVKYFTGQLNDASQRLKSAALRGPQAYTSELARVTGKNPELANLFPPAPEPGQPWNAQDMATAAASAGATGEQFITAQNMMKYREDLLAIRDRMADIAQQRADHAEAFTANGRPLTQGQQKVEARNIANDEYGTPSRPGGLHLERLRVGNVLKNGTDPKTNSPLTPQQLGDWQARYQGATDALQGLQFRKADLYGIQRPDAASVLNSKNGETVTAPDGSVWRKQDDVLYFQGKGNGTEQFPLVGHSSQSPRQTPPPTPPPAATAPPPAAAPPAQQPPPQQQPPAQPAPQGNDIVHLKMPDGKYISGPKAKVEAWMKENHISYSQEPTASPNASNPPAAPQQTNTPKTPQTWAVGGKTYTEGQVLYNRDGKRVKVTGVANGKLQGELLDK